MSGPRTGNPVGVEIREVEVVLAKAVAWQAIPVLELKTAAATVQERFKHEETTLRWVLKDKLIIDAQSGASLRLLRTHRIWGKDDLKLKQEWTLSFHEMANRDPTNPYIVQTHDSTIKVYFDHKDPGSSPSQPTQIPAGGTPVPAPVTAEEAHEAAKTAVSNMKTLGSPTEGVVSAVNSTNDHVSSFLDTFSKFNDIVSEIASVHPYARTAWAILSFASKLIIDQVNRDNSIRSLVLKMDEVYTFLTGEELRRIESMKIVVERITHQTLECSYFIQEYSKNEKFRTRLIKNLLSGTDDRVKKFNDVFDKLMQEFRDDAIGDTLVVVYRIRDHFEGLAEALDLNNMQELDLNDMQYARAAGLNTQKLCLEGTRSEILNDITEWIDNYNENDTPRLFWLHGTAGSGKSAIAHTIARRFEFQERLGSFFCFDRNRAADRRHEKIFSTIARDLSARNRRWRKALAAAVYNNTSLRSTPDVLRQWEELIVQPAKAMLDAIAGPIVIVIDAFDESGDAESRRYILRILAGKHAKAGKGIMDLPPNFRILLTLRPLEDVIDAFKHATHVRQKSMESIPSLIKDVERYVTDQLSEIELGPALPTVSTFESLARKSEGLFEWARLACAYMKGENGVGAGLSVERRFNNIMARKDVLLLDGMYRLTLGAMLPGEELERRHYINCFKSVMAQILGTMEPLPLTSLQAMRHRFVVESDIELRSIVIPMGALLGGTADSSMSIRALHASFPDFLIDRDRSGEYFIDILSVQEDLAMSCLRVMEKELQFNICEIPSSYLPNSKVSDLDDRVKEHISPELAYSCRFWIAHVRSMPFKVSVADTICNFFSEKQLLFWFEVLSLLKSINTCAGSLSSLIQWIMHEEEYQGVVDDAVDARKFLRLFSGVISFSTPHLYLSALPFSPKSSRISKRFADKFRCSAKIVSDHNGTWPLLQGELHGHSGSVRSVAFSVDGKHIVSGSDDNTIQLWDAETGEPLRAPLKGHQDSVRSVAFSLDGKYIVSGSDDKTIRLWDAVTGEQLQAPLQGHEDRVTSVAFSPDGKCVASGSDDSTIRLWDVKMGVPLRAPLEGHERSVMSVAFSPNDKGMIIASGSDDGTIRLWDAKMGVPLRAPIDGQCSVTSIAFSPDGECIASGCLHGTIQLWYIETGEPLLHFPPKQEGSVQSVAFSPDGHSIVSGSIDGTVQFWCSKTGVQEKAPLKGHQGSVLSVAFAPDGKRIMSGLSNNTIQLWDTEAEEPLSAFEAYFKGHQDLVMPVSVAFSLDGKCIRSKSLSGPIQLWDVETGAPLHVLRALSIKFSDGKPLVTSLTGSLDDLETISRWDEMAGGPAQAWIAHQGEVLAVAFSPNGKRMVLGMSNNTIELWDTETGKLVQRPLEGHEDAVWSVAFSLPDGKCIVSGSADKTIRLWDAETGKPLQAPLEGHQDSVRSVAFSPDGKHIVSGSDDKTVRLWDTETVTGEPLQVPLKGHQGSVSAVAFSPDGKCIVSGSFDETIQLWDAKTGLSLQAPLAGHQGRVLSLAFSPDGKHILSGSSDNTMRLLDKIDAKVTFSSNKEHALHDPAGIFQHTKINKQGWFTGHDGELLFWVPVSLRYTLFIPGNRMVFPRGVQVDVSHMAHGDGWYMVNDVD